MADETQDAINLGGTSSEVLVDIVPVLAVKPAVLQFGTTDVEVEYVRADVFDAVRAAWEALVGAEGTERDHSIRNLLREVDSEREVHDGADGAV